MLIKTYVKNSPLVKDSVWALIGSVAAKGLALVAAIYTARKLGKDVYGEYGMIRNTLMNIAIFSTFGLGYTSTKFIADYKNKLASQVRAIESGTMYITIITSGVMALLLFIFAQPVAVKLETPHLVLSLRIFASTILFNAISTTQIGVLSGFNEYKAIAKNNAIAGGITFVLTVLFTYLWELEGALAALLISNIINCILNNISIRRVLATYERKKPTKELIADLFSFSLPVALQEGLYSISSWLSMLLLIKYATYGDVGLYAAAGQWAIVIMFIPGVLRNVTLSHLSGSVNDVNKHRKTFRSMLLINFISTSIPFLAIYSFSGFIGSFYGDTFDSLQTILNLSLFTTIFSCLINVYFQEFMSRNKNWLMFLIRLIRDSGIIVITYILLVNGSKDYSGAYYLVISTLAISVLTLILLQVLYYYGLKKS